MGCLRPVSEPDSRIDESHADSAPLSGADGAATASLTIGRPEARWMGEELPAARPGAWSAQVHFVAQALEQAA
eukprot:9314169-Alexandrium_andersonii.AAC.1